jgi:hypothetical protein
MCSYAAASNIFNIVYFRIGTNYFHQGIRKHIPIVHWKELRRPLVICVASKRAGAELEENIQSLNLVEGVDFYRFN